MNIQKNIIKLLSIISISVVCILSICFFFSCKSNNDGKKDNKDVLSIMQGVPSDAIMIFHFKEMSQFLDILTDTLSFGEQIIDKSSGLIKFQQQLSSISSVINAPLLYSLHYSAKNEVSFLQVMNLNKSSRGEMQNILEKSLSGRREYNGVRIYGGRSNVLAALKDSILVVSNSESVIESSIRHLVINTSILDNLEFKDLASLYGGESALYINNKQIGKFFSGEIAYNYLGYSDFFLNLSSWCAFKLTPSNGKLNLDGAFLDNRDPKNFSSIFYNAQSVKCEMGEVLPYSTLFALWLPISSSNSYLSGLNSFMEVHRSKGRYAYKQNLVSIKGAKTPIEWADSLDIDGIAAAYCKFGDKNEWVTLIKKRSSYWKTISNRVFNRDSIAESGPFKYKGYLAAVYGDSFGMGSDEYYVNLGDWTILSSKGVIEEYISGSANFYNLSYFLDQTPANKFLNTGSLAKALVNINEAPTEVLKIFKPYLKTQFERSAKSHNFEYLTLDILRNSSIGANINYYAQNLLELPKPPEVEVGSLPIIIDSTIVLPKGPFKISDVAKGESAYLSQLPNNQLQYLNKNKKGVWTIPFSAPICGAVEQVDFYNNGKLQMLFIQGNKLYLLDRAARFVNKYPVKLSSEVLYGPKVVEIGDDISFLTLNSNNSISQYTLDGKKVKGWSDIKAPEFVKELPQIKVIGDKKYWVLRTVLYTRIYELDGKEVLIADKKRFISPDSSIEYIGENKIKVKGVDERYFSLDLKTGKTRKLR